MGQRSKSWSLRPHKSSASKPAGIEYGLFAHEKGRSAWGLFARQRLRSKKASVDQVETHVYSLDNSSVSVSLAVPASLEVPGEPLGRGPLEGHGRLEAQKLYRSTLELRISPAEEALAKYILDNADTLAPAGNSTLELGAGHFGFVGLAVAVATEAKCVQLTDGSSHAVADLEKQVALNRHRCHCEVVSKVLQWEQCWVNTLQDSFDLVVGADIVFRDGAHRALLGTIAQVLARHGVAVLCASFRNHQVEAFLDLARSQFITTVKVWEDDEGMLQELVHIRGIERPPVILITLRHIPPPTKKGQTPSTSKEEVQHDSQMRHCQEILA